MSPARHSRLGMGRRGRFTRKILRLPQLHISWESLGVAKARRIEQKFRTKRGGREQPPRENDCDALYFTATCGRRFEKGTGGELFHPLRFCNT